jgi:hypothetical protein
MRLANIFIGILRIKTDITWPDEFSPILLREVDNSQTSGINAEILRTKSICDKQKYYFATTPQPIVERLLSIR